MAFSFYSDVTVRLRGGPSWNQGRVEIYHDGKWGTICDNDFDIVDADVICRMLGHKGAWSTYCCGWFGYGIGEIWLDSVQCSGDETSIAQCSHGGWGNHEDVCTHYNDAGVYCIPNPSSRPGNIAVTVPKLDKPVMKVAYDFHSCTKK